MPPTYDNAASASGGNTTNNVDAYHIIMQSELLTDHCTLRTGLGDDDDIFTNDSVVEQLTYSNGFLQNLRETGDTKCKICHHDLLISNIICNSYPFERMQTQQSISFALYSRGGSIDANASPIIITNLF